VVKTKAGYGVLFLLCLVSPAHAQIVLSWAWTSEIQETGFDVERSPSGCTQWSIYQRLGVDVMSTEDAEVAGTCYRVRAFDATQFYPYSNTFIVSGTPPPPSDTEAPKVSILSPANGSSVARRSTVTIRSSFTDNVGVTSVRYFVNGTLLTNCGGTSAQCSWSVPNPPNKTYTLKVEARDAAGNVGSAQVSVRSSK